MVTGKVSGCVEDRGVRLKKNNLKKGISGRDSYGVGGRELTGTV